MSLIAPKLQPLALQEISSYSGMTHFAAITADALTQTTAATAQTITLATIPAGYYVIKSEMRLVKPFKDASDNAFNTTTASLGDGTGVATHIAAKELNENGTEITTPQLNNTAVGPYAADSTLTITFNSMAAKSLNNIDVGEVHVLVQLFNPKGLSDVKRLSPITTK